MITLYEIRVMRVSSTRETRAVDFSDRRSVQLPLLWYPRLFRTTQAQRDVYELLVPGLGVLWPDLDKDVSAKSLALGKPSVEFLKTQPASKSPEAEVSA